MCIRFLSMSLKVQSFKNLVFTELTVLLLFYSKWSSLLLYFQNDEKGLHIQLKLSQQLHTKQNLIGQSLTNQRDELSMLKTQLKDVGGINGQYMDLLQRLSSLEVLQTSVIILVPLFPQTLGFIYVYINPTKNDGLHSVFKCSLSFCWTSFACFVHKDFFKFSILWQILHAWPVT